MRNISILEMKVPFIYVILNAKKNRKMTRANTGRIAVKKKIKFIVIVLK